MDQNDLSLDLLLQETLALTEYLRTNSMPAQIESESIQTSFLPEADDTDYLFDLADSMIQDEVTIPELMTQVEIFAQELEEKEAAVFVYPESPGIIYKIDKSQNSLKTYILNYKD